jgi:hypothetical protein
LQDAFDALGTSLEEMIEICESAIIPADIMDVGLYFLPSEKG